MAPRFRSKAPKGPVVPLFDARRDKKTDPVRLAYVISEEAAHLLVYAVNAGKTQPKTADGYICRHLVDKGLLVRQPGRNTSYKPTLRGEAVYDQLKKRFPYMFEPKT